MGKFGWDLPPGVTTSMLPGNEVAICDVCGKSDDDCVCPECPTCSEIGRVDCYKGHGLKLSKQQLIHREEARIGMMEERIQDTKMFLDHLRETSDEDFKEWVLSDVVPVYELV